MIRIIKRVCITEKGTNKSKNIKLSIIGTKLSKRSDIFNWGQIVHNWDIIVRIKYKDYIHYLFQLVGVQKGHNQLSKLKHCQRHNGPRNWLHGCNFTMTINFSFLATLVALHFTPVSDWVVVSTSVALSFASLFLGMVRFGVEILIWSFCKNYMLECR